ERELGPAASWLYESISGSAADQGQLDAFARQMWGRYANGEISDDEATFLGSFIDRQRPKATRHRPVSNSAARGAVIGFPTKSKPQRSPDRQRSYERRHRRAYAGVMPPHLAGLFTVGEMASLGLIGEEHKAKGSCRLSLDEIAARAGTSRATTKRARSKRPAG